MANLFCNLRGHLMKTRCLLLATLFSLVTALYADGPGDNLPDNVRPVPPPGVAVPEPERAALQAGVDELGT